MERESLETFHVIDIESIEESIDIQLSELADNFRIIQLETSDQAIIGTKSFYVTDDYIIAFNKDGFYKFSSEGRFIRKIVNVGHGPFEISNFVNYSVNETLDLLVINDDQRQNDFLIYDISSEEFLNPVKKCFPSSRTLFLCDDSLIIGAFGSSGQVASDFDKTYAVSYQDLDGGIVSGIQHDKRYPASVFKEEPFRSVWLSYDGQQYHARFSNEDTLFIVKRNQLIPYLVLSYEKQPYDGTRQAGDWFYTFYEYESLDYIGFRKSVITESTPVSVGEAGVEVVRLSIELSHYFFDKNSEKPFIINSVTDDFTGKQIDLDQMLVLYPDVLTINGKLVLTYYPYEIEEIIARGAENVNLPPELWDQLVNISKTLKEDDNPVLLVGDAKGLF